MPRESTERIAELYYKYRRELPRLELGRSTWYQPTLCMCVFHWRTIALHSYFSYVAYRPGRAFGAAPPPPMHKRMWPSFGGIWSTVRNSVKDHRHLSATPPMEGCRHDSREIPSPSRERADVRECNRLSLHVFILFVSKSQKIVKEIVSCFSLPAGAKLLRQKFWFFAPLTRRKVLLVNVDIEYQFN